MFLNFLIDFKDGHFFVLFLYPIDEVEDGLLGLEGFFCLFCTDGDGGEDYSEEADVVEELVVAEGAYEKQCHQCDLEVESKGVAMFRVQ